MFKRLASTLLVLAAIVLTPLLIGCEKNEIKTHREVEVQKQVISQDTVVQ